MLSFLKNIQALYLYKETYQNSATKAIFKAITKVLETLENDVSDIIIEGSILTARGNWLDEWGKWLDVTRFVRETDDAFRVRILNRLKYSATTIESIKVNSSNFYNSQIDIGWKYNKDDWKVIENWRYVNLLSERGQLSSDFRFPDGSYYNWCTIQIISPTEISKEYRELIDSIKAAGILVYYAIALMPDSFMKTIKYLYRSDVLNTKLKEVGELHGYYNGVVAYGGYYGSDLPLVFEAPEDYTDDYWVSLITRLYSFPEALRNEPIEKKREFLETSTDDTYESVIKYREYKACKDFYTLYLPEGLEHYGSDAVRKGVLYHISSIVGARVAGLVTNSAIVYGKTQYEWFGVQQPTVKLIIFPKAINYSFYSSIHQSGGKTIDYLGNFARETQDWASELTTVEDIIYHYGEVPLLDLQWARAMNIDKLHSFESKFI